MNAPKLGETLALAITTVAMVGAAAVFMLAGAVESLKALKLPPWLAYGLLGSAGALAGFLLRRA